VSALEVSLEGVTQWFSLEIGTQGAGKTFFQIDTEGGLARWPYGSKELFLLYAPEPFVEPELFERVD
jgi:hypothetical protein